MEAIIRTNDRNLFQTALAYLKSLQITVETKPEKSSSKIKPQKNVEKKESKKFNPKDYEGILSPLNLNIENELLDMRKTWRRNF